MKNNDEQLFSADTKLLDTNIEEELGKINNLNSDTLSIGETLIIPS